MFGDPEQAHQRIDDWQAAVEARAARARELAQRQGELAATVSVAEGSVTVTVDHSGIREGDRGTFMQPDNGYAYYLQQLNE